VIESSWRPHPRGGGLKSLELRVDVLRRGGLPERAGNQSISRR
jgi:hypothetical protein